MKPPPFLRSPLTAYFAAPPLVGLATWLLHLVQMGLAQTASDGRLAIPRPFGIGFVVVVAVVSRWGGWGPGVFALALSLASTVYLLLPPKYNWLLQSPTDIAQITVIFLVGMLVTGAMNAARQAQVRSDELLEESKNAQARLQAVMDAAPIGVLTCDADGVLNYANPETERIWGQALAPVGVKDYSRYKLLGLDGQPRPPEKRGITRVLNGEDGVVADDILVEQPGGTRLRASVQSKRIAGENNATLGAVTVLWDTTEIYKAQEALRESEERFRATHEASPDGFMVMESVRNETGAIYDFRIVYLNAAAEAVIGRTAADLTGKQLLVEMPGNVESGLFERYKRVAETGHTEQWEFYYNHEGIDSWFSNTVVQIGDGFAVRFIDISPRKAAEAERARLLLAAQKKAEQESLLNRIGQAQRVSDAPNYVQGIAVSALGEALKADRCYFATIDTENGTFSVAQDWHSPSLSSMTGTHRAADYVADLAVFFADETAIAVEDAQTDNRVARLAERFVQSGLRAFIAVPFFERSKLAAALVVAQAAPRLWTPDEMETIARVAAQTRTAVDLALLRARDHTIAERLENALRPTLPDTVPHFDVAYFYKAALAESSIGGDFFDVFMIEARVVLVIGDLSGKGLAAAAQIATVRNMLRFALYQSKTIAEALTRLNDTVAGQNLLTGFATLFVSVFDPKTQTLTYGSCGHDPIILRRAQTGTTELLEATGPVMGGFPGIPYDEETLPLCPGDTLVLYTDGLSEAGRLRHEFLGTEGLVSLVENGPLFPNASSEEIVSRIVEGVSRHAQNAFHDDQCLLVAALLPPPEKIPA